MSRARVYVHEPQSDAVLARLGVAGPVRHAPQWWRSHYSECLEWWAAFVASPNVTELAMAAVLRAIFWPHGDPLLPLCAIEPEALAPFLKPR